MNKKSATSKDTADKLIKNICRKTHQTSSAQEKSRVVLAAIQREE